MDELVAEVEAIFHVRATRPMIENASKVDASMLQGVRPRLHEGGEGFGLVEPTSRQSTLPTAGVSVLHQAAAAGQTA